MDGFVHLHVHSEYSLLDGACRIKKLVLAAKELGMNALALTDHGNLFGAIEFYSACKEAGIKPILGMEAYISPTTRFDRSMSNPATAAYHLLLLAMNQTGWKNLMKLSTRAYLEGFYYKPRIDRELLGQFNEGLIATTACLGGEVPTALLTGQFESAEKIARSYLDIFGRERFFIEVQNQLLTDQDKANTHLVELAKKLELPLVGTNDVHFLRRQDKQAHEVLTCISTGKTLTATDRMEYSPELFLKSPAEMRSTLANLPTEAADNTLRIAEMCQLKLDFGHKHLPACHTPDGSSPDDYLRRIAFEALAAKMKGQVPPEYAQRLDRELEVIKGKGYSSYVLVVADFVRFAHANSIPCGARGSGCATLLGYCLDIVQLDPIRYGLLFERWTDPQRDEDPDFDIDMCQEGRARVLQYVREKYKHMAQIITYGTLKARAVVRDVGRVMDMPLNEVDAIAKKVPEGLKVTLDSALESEPELRSMYESDEKVRKLIDHGRTLEGMARHAGVHAAGVIIADVPLEEVVPLCRRMKSSAKANAASAATEGEDGEEIAAAGAASATGRHDEGDDPITQWDGPTCDKIGLMKMDFLGLRTLTILQRARELVKETTGQDLDPEALSLDDPAVYQLFCQGATDGVFQFESEGMKNILLSMQPARIEDLIAANAMYRPGPMELIPTYCARKAGKEGVPSVHKLVDDILAETYGIMVYQEQVMQVLNRLGKLPLNTALTLIKAISKKKEKAIAAEKPKFLQGAQENGISQQEAERLFDLILKFAGYGFNKAHSTRYAIIAYQTAYFKVHHRRQFLAALLTYESVDTDKIVQYMGEAGRMGITVSAPDINTSRSDFTVDGERIRFGLAAVKGAGDKAVQAVIDARSRIGRFANLYHFCEGVDLRAVNRATIEALIKCGAFDALGAHRAAMLAAVPHAIELGNAAADDRRSGQMNFFSSLGSAGAGETKAPPRFPNVEPLSESQLLQFEKETLGFYVTSHPLVKYGRELSSLGSATCAAMQDLGDGSQAVLGCMIGSVRARVTKSGRSAGRTMAMATVKDLTGSAEVVAFAETYEKVGKLLSEEAIVFLVGSVDRRREKPQLIIDEVVPIERAIELLTGSVMIRLENALAVGQLQAVGDVLRRHRGRCPLYVELAPLTRGDVRTVVRPAADWNVAPSRLLYDELCQALGQENVLFTGKRGGNGNGNGGSGRRNYESTRPRQQSIFASSGPGPM